MKWVKASESDVVDMQRKHWRCGKTHEPLTAGVAYNLFFKTKNSHPVEWLDESTPPVSAMEDGWVDFVNDYIDAWEDGMAGDSSLYNKAKTLTTPTK